MEGLALNVGHECAHVGGVSVSLQSLPPDCFNGRVYYFCEKIPCATTGMSTFRIALSSIAHHQQVSSVYGFLRLSQTVNVERGPSVGLSPGYATLKSSAVPMTSPIERGSVFLLRGDRHQPYANSDLPISLHISLCLQHSPPESDTSFLAQFNARKAVFFHVGHLAEGRTAMVVLLHGS